MVDHDKLANLDYDSAGHIGFASQDVLTMVSGVLNDLILESNDFGDTITVSGTYKGDTLTVVVDDDSTVFGNVLYQASDFHYERADADIYTTMPCRAIAIESGAGNKKVLVRGQICDTCWDWSPGTIWASLVTGGLTQTKPSGNDDQVQEIGWALSVDTVFFDFMPPTTTAIVGDRGVFGGSGTNNEIMDYITISTTVNAADFGDLLVGRYGNTGTSNSTNDRGVFAGGDTGSLSNVIDYITIDITGNSIDFGDLTVTRRYLAGTSNGTNERGIFGGGYTTGWLNIIDYITVSTTGNAADFGDLTVARHMSGACSNGINDRGVFAGGDDGAEPYGNTIDYVTISTTGNAVDFGDLTSEMGWMAGTSNGINDRGIFLGGYIENIIEYITISTTGNATDFGDLTVSRGGPAATSNGVNERGVVGGGTTGTSSNVIDYVTINSIGNATDFGDLTVARGLLGACSDA